MGVGIVRGEVKKLTSKVVGRGVSSRLNFRTMWGGREGIAKSEKGSGLIGRDGERCLIVVEVGLEVMRLRGNDNRCKSG